MKTLFRLSAIAMLFLSPLLKAQQLTETQIFQACSQTVQNYAVYRDALDAENYASVFTEDAVFTALGKTHRGKKELMAYIEGQPKDIQTLHHISTQQISKLDTNTAEGVIYAQVIFSKNDQPPGTKFREAHAIYLDRYKFNKKDCKIAERRLKILTLDQL